MTDTTCLFDFLSLMPEQLCSLDANKMLDGSTYPASFCFDKTILCVAENAAGYHLGLATSSTADDVPFEL